MSLNFWSKIFNVNVVLAAIFAIPAYSQDLDLQSCGEYTFTATAVGAGSTQGNAVIDCSKKLKDNCYPGTISEPSITVSFTRRTYGFDIDCSGACTVVLASCDELFNAAQDAIVSVLPESSHFLLQGNKPSTGF